MSDKTEKQVSTLSVAVVTSIVTALTSGIVAAKNSANSLLEFCKACAKNKLPITVPEPDVIAVADAVAAKMGWNDPAYKRAKVSKSEVRSLIRQHALLPEAIVALRASAHGACGYHDAVKVSRLIAEHGNIGDAVTAFNAVKEAAKVDPRVKAQNGLKAWYASVRDGAKSPKRTKLMSLIVNFANECELDIGLGG